MVLDFWGGHMWLWNSDENYDDTHNMLFKTLRKDAYEPLNSYPS